MKGEILRGIVNKFRPVRLDPSQNLPSDGRRYRHELKYLINEGDLAVLRGRMTPVFSPDCHAESGYYTVRSLYFDDYWNSAREEKEMGIFARKKYRIRLYNGDAGYIRLERKTKRGNYILKESAGVTRDTVEQILEGNYDSLLNSSEPLCREFYVECMCSVMRPRVIVDYDREPYVLEEGNVRVTFDRRVRAAVLSMDLFDPALPVMECLEPGKLIMEVKYTEFLPKIAQELLPVRASEFTAVSKYVLCADKTGYLREQAYWQESANPWDLRLADTQR